MFCCHVITFSLAQSYQRLVVGRQYLAMHIKNIFSTGSEDPNVSTRDPEEVSHNPPVKNHCFKQVSTILSGINP
jgi:hypothetical protein